LLRDPLTGVNADEEWEPLNPTRTIINVGPSALIWPSTEMSIPPMFALENPSMRIVVAL